MRAQSVDAPALRAGPGRAAQGGKTRLQGKDTGGHSFPSQVVRQTWWAPSLGGTTVGSGEKVAIQNPAAEIDFNLYAQQFESSNTNDDDNFNKTSTSFS